MKIKVGKLVALAIQYGPLIAAFVKDAKEVVKPAPKPSAPG